MMLVLVRHGQSVWNAKNLFTGWRDVELSDKGRDEARAAGRQLTDKKFHFDAAWTSALARAQSTCQIILHEMKQSDIAITADKALNERNYGDLSGINKDEARKKFGAEQVHQWRRGFASAPPGGESLKDTYARTVPYYEKNIQPLLLAGKNILIAAHGNSLRALVMRLEQLSPEEITKIEIPTGRPLIYFFDDQGGAIKNLD